MMTYNCKFIYSDGPKDEKSEEKVKEAREYLKTIEGFKKVTIIEREKNYGLANNIIDGVTKIVNEYGKVIVLEDDLITSPYFLKFMNEALEVYKDEERVAEIMGYSYFEKYIDKLNLDDFIVIKGADCLGWGTWQRAWKYFDCDGKKLLEKINNKNLKKDFNVDNSFDFYNMLKLQVHGKIDSWAIRWLASAYLNDLYTIYPARSYVLHIGNDGYGTNYTFNTHEDPLVVPLCNNIIEVKKIEIREKPNSREAYKRFLLHYKKSFLKRLYMKIMNLLRNLR